MMQHARFILISAAIGAGTAARAADPEPGPLARLDPVAIAPIYWSVGHPVVGATVPVAPFASRLTGMALAFDQFQGDQSSPLDFPPIGGNLPPCSATSPENRYVFGPTARNVHLVGDFANAAAASVGAPIHTVCFGWYWNPPGASQQTPSNEYLTIDIEWWQEFNVGCDLQWAGSPDSITAARGHIGGVRLYYNRPGTPGGHYSVVDVSMLNLPAMTSRSGAFEMKFLQLPPGSTAIAMPADYSSRAQPYLWGTQSDISPPPYQGQPRPGGPGSPQQWNDNGGQSTAVVDGSFSAGECQNYSYAGLCYNPLGPMIAWFYQICETVPAFTLTNPANGASGVSREEVFSWSSVNAPAATIYEIEIRNESDDTLVFSQSGLTAHEFQMPAGMLQYCGRYRWAVTASADAACPVTVAGPRTFMAETSLAADFNHDLVVDFNDYLDFVDAFSTGAPEGDFNGDGIIDFNDYLDFVDGFSQGC